MNKRQKKKLTKRAGIYKYDQFKSICEYACDIMEWDNCKNHMDTIRECICISRRFRQLYVSNICREKLALSSIYGYQLSKEVLDRQRLIQDLYVSQPFLKNILKNKRWKRRGCV